jgi:hypothetical protein
LPSLIDRSNRSNGESGEQGTFSAYSEQALDAVTLSIKRLEEIFKREFDIDVYLTWGTLLGAVRDGDYIAFDNDVDRAYLTNRSADFEIVEEHELIVRVLRQQGFPVQQNSKGQIHVRVHPDSQIWGGAIFNLDLWTTWAREGQYFHYPDIKGEVAADEVLPLRRFYFRGQFLWIPQGYQQVLHRFYGEGWRKPDPNYAWYPRYDADDQFEFLRSAPAVPKIPSHPVKARLLQIIEKEDLYYINGPGLKEEQRLNPTAMVILELCNGANSCSEIINLLQETYQLSSAPEVVVLEFLSNAVQAGLVLTENGNS